MLKKYPDAYKRALTRVFGDKVLLQNPCALTLSLSVSFLCVSHFFVCVCVHVYVYVWIWVWVWMCRVGCALGVSSPVFFVCNGCSQIPRNVTSIRTFGGALIPEQHSLFPEG